MYVAHVTRYYVLRTLAMINVVEQGISRNRCTKDHAIFNFARQLFDKSSLLPTKILLKRSVRSNSTTFYVLCHAKCLLNRVVKGMSISSNPKFLCHSNGFFSSLIRSANLEFQSLDLLSRNYGTKNEIVAST